MYQLIRTDTFDVQLREIIFRISDNFGRDKALEVLDDIEHSLTQLSDFPRLGPEPKYVVLKRQGFRVLVLKKNLVFYKVNDKSKTVTIEAIVDARRDYVRIVLGVSDLDAWEKE